MRIIIDTNVLVSGLLFPNSDTAKAVREIIDNHDVLTSVDTLNELKEVLQKPKLHKYATPEKLTKFFISYEQITIQTEIIIAVEECRDPKDNKFLEVAINGDADTIVTGDKDLLVLNPFINTKIITPAEFLSTLT